MRDFHAEIRVCSAGYRWEPSTGHELNRLVPCDPDCHTKPESEVFRIYNPFEQEPALFRLFAEIDGTDAFYGTKPRNERAYRDATVKFGRAVVAFANKFGAPTVEPDLTLNAPATGSEIATTIMRMRLALKLWNAITSRDSTAIRSIVRWDSQLKWIVSWAGYEIAPAHPIQAMFEQSLLGNRRPRREAKGDDVFTLAVEVLTHLIAAHVRANLEFVRVQEGFFALRTEVKSLLAVIWLQLALAIVENKEYRQCGFCEKWFELGHRRRNRQGRNDRQYCTTNCRVQAWRKVKKKADGVTQERSRSSKACRKRKA